MNALMALYDSELRDEVFTLMELAKIKSYTQFVGLHGSSEHGKKEGTVAWPGSNEIVLIIVNDEQKAHFHQIVTDYKNERSTRPGLLLFDWNLNEVC
ncbi:MAG: hypothetical protein H6624_07190 [Bdellovibrionaceae bacterium]|nr:hypothetical protein [Bdellovibrionales bacterium]MCB9084112.1 hypothetical protein [Pseudobdellovibrionaceae bacterium]